MPKILSTGELSFPISSYCDSKHKVFCYYSCFICLTLRFVYLRKLDFLCRDIKGANILVDPYGRVKLADFGMAKHVSVGIIILDLK